MKPSRSAAKVAIDAAFKAYEKKGHKAANNKVMVVINMDEPSYRHRLYVVNLETKEIERTHHVSHGVQSSNKKDRAYATKFSNEEGSHKSSIGAMVTGNTYRGKHGLSLKLKGLEKRNSNVEKRYIVLHKAWYVTDGYIMQHGRAGQSHGCPAVDPNIGGSLINLIKGGVFFYIYSEQLKK